MFMTKHNSIAFPNNSIYAVDLICLYLLELLKKGIKYQQKAILAVYIS